MVFQAENQESDNNYTPTFTKFLRQPKQLQKRPAHQILTDGTLMTELFLCQQMLKLQLQMDQSHQSQSQFRSTGLSTSMKPTDRPFLDAILKLDILFLGYLIERDLEMLSQGLHLCIFLEFLSLAPS
jgi:hypothetical protein